MPTASGRARISPRRGIVTSPTGAVIRDFLNIVARRPLGPQRASLPRVCTRRPGASRSGSSDCRAQRLRTCRRDCAGARRRIAGRPGGLQQRARSPRHRRVNLPVVSPSATRRISPSPTSPPTCAPPTPSAAAELITRPAQDCRASGQSGSPMETCGQLQFLQARQRLTRLPVSAPKRASPRC